MKFSGKKKLVSCLLNHNKFNLFFSPTTMGHLAQSHHELDLKTHEDKFCTHTHTHSQKIDPFAMHSSRQDDEFFKIY